MIKLLLASTSTLPGGRYLDYLLEPLAKHFASCDDILFIPYACPGGISEEEYTIKVRETFRQIGKNIVGLHTFSNPSAAINQAQGYFTGGGNTFVLVNKLYQQGVLLPLKHELLRGKPYFGSSAGINIAGQTMQTTNDMPIVYPPSFETLGLVPFNLNPHYLDAQLQSQHMGETRETRIKEFHCLHKTPVLGLREGSWLTVAGTEITLHGSWSARLFLPQETPIEITPGAIGQHFS